MTLNDLEFKAEDFSGCKLSIEAIAWRVNFILRERLEKAPKVFSEGRSLTTLERGTRWSFSAWRKRPTRATHTARLVCVEEIK